MAEIKGDKLYLVCGRASDNLVAIWAVWKYKHLLKRYPLFNKVLGSVALRTWVYRVGRDIVLLVRTRGYPFNENMLGTAGVVFLGEGKKVPAPPSPGCAVRWDSFWRKPIFLCGAFWIKELYDSPGWGWPW